MGKGGSRRRRGRVSSTAGAGGPRGPPPAAPPPTPPPARSAGPEAVRAARAARERGPPPHLRRTPCPAGSWLRDAAAESRRADAGAPLRSGAQPPRLLPGRPHGGRRVGPEGLRRPPRGHQLAQPEPGRAAPADGQRGRHGPALEHRGRPVLRAPARYTLLPSPPSARPPHTSALRPAGRCPRAQPRPRRGPCRGALVGAQRASCRARAGWGAEPAGPGCPGCGGLPSPVRRVQEITAVTAALRLHPRQPHLRALPALGSAFPCLSLPEWPLAGHFLQEPLSPPALARCGRHRALPCPVLTLLLAQSCRQGN